MMRERINRSVDTWREALGATTSNDSAVSCASGLDSMQIGDGWSQLAGYQDGTDYHAARLRAWCREQSNRDEQVLSSCKRARKNSAIMSPASSHVTGHISARSKPRFQERLHLSGRRRGEWPLGNPPKHIRKVARQVHA